MTVSRSRGIVTSMFRRLCSRAPRMMRASSAIARESCFGVPSDSRESLLREPLGLAKAGAHRTPHQGRDYIRASRLCLLDLYRMPHTDAVVVLTTVATPDEGVALVRALLERR